MNIRMGVSRLFSLALLFTVCILSSSGCGGKERVVSVSGTVTHNGQPVPGLVVSFVPEAPTEAGVSTGETDATGKYTLTVFKSGKSGAVVGTHKVWVSLPRVPPPDDDGESAEARRQKMKAAAAKQPVDIAEILKKYGNLDKSPLTVEVKDNGTIDLKLD